MHMKWVIISGMRTAGIKIRMLPTTAIEEGYFHTPLGGAGRETTAVPMHLS